MDSTLRIALQAATEHLSSLDHRSVAATVTAAELRARLGGDVPQTGTDPDQVIRDLVRAVDGGILGSAGGRFFGWVVGGALPVAVAADWLTSAWDNNAALYACGPAAAVVEEIAGGWLKQILGLPERASFAFVSGCQMAHLTCLAAARHALLARRGWNVEEQGLHDAPRLRILSSAQRHGSIDRAVRVLGLGTSSFVFLDNLEDLAIALDADAPSIVLLQAGDINTGAFDSFESVIPVAKQHGAWVHVDGAFGLWATASPAYRHLTRGVETADSWATDGHKWLNTPFDCGYAFIADADAHRAAIAYRAGYLTHAEDARDQIDWNPDWSRRARGFPTYAALRHLGRQGIADLVERCCRHTRALIDGMAQMPGVEVLSEPVINQALVRFRNADTDQVIAAINRTGEAFFTGTTWRGRRAMRVSVCNWRTTEEDVRRTLACIRKIVE